LKDRQKENGGRRREKERERVGGLVVGSPNETHLKLVLKSKLVGAETFYVGVWL
jgi:hypothetical protein